MNRNNNLIRKLLDQTKESTHIFTTYKQQSMSTSFLGSVNPDSQKVVEFQEDEHQPLAQDSQDTSLEEMNENESQNTTNTEAQSSKSVRGYDKPPALT